MKILLASLLFVFALLGACRVDAAAPQASVPAATAPISEQQKIEILLSSIGRLQGAVFIRNGSEYTAAQAVDHLRYKWNHAGDRVKTAEDFIVLCATKSSMSGLPYRIRLADGTTMDSAVFLEQQLKRMPAAPGSATSVSRH
jgi:hypothetical protein